ncbi:MAG: energy-coupling factor ABC transporter ATP-binding protein [Clostridia bacterium]|nr:energy-coupling factor ABC transporter ATP-binding protein [Clostridia bacterium]
MISLEKVSFGYGEGSSTVRDISFHIEKGEFVAILGANGAGKTTTVKLIDGLLKPTKGKVVINGLDTSKTRVSERARHVGFLFQNPDRQICRNTVREELAFGLETVKKDMSREDIDRRVGEVMESFGFSGDEEPFSLSRGERQRVALASVITVQPEIMILDEPTTGLDYRECSHIMDVISDMNRTMGTTVVMVCHDMEVVMSYARRALVMAGGRLLADGTVRSVFRDTELMLKASLLPPQITELSMRLGKGFENADTVGEMTARICSEMQVRRAGR